MREENNVSGTAPIVPVRRTTGIWFLIFLIQLALQSCAIGRPAMVFHSFSFDLGYDSPDAQVLDYRYGNDKGEIHMNRGMVQRGQGGMQYGTSGDLPRGDFLYVKWRIRSTGQVYEDRVDLTHRLPADIADHRITFFMKGPQLYVYLISAEEDRRPESWPEGPIRLYRHLKQYQIYPGQPAW
jgi:hypothetical protein